MTIRQRIGEIVDSPKVQKFIMGLIIFNAATLGLETSETVHASFGPVLSVLDQVVLGIFVIEVTAKMIARGFGFFKSGWNVFDFIIVGIALVPSSGPLSVLRALRILRAFRLMSVVPQMRKVVQALIYAIPGMLSIVALITLIFYVTAVMTTNLFGADFSEWFGTLGRSMYSLFQIMTLESWSMGIVRPVMEIYPYAWVLFVPFILVTSFAVINLFIGVIVDSMQTHHISIEAVTEQEPDAIAKSIDSIEKELQQLRQMVDRTAN
jgi:voltage-gated sodium channel